MKKTLLTFTFCASAALAGLVDGIAAVVNDQPITLYEIDQTKEKMKVDGVQALNLLIDKRLEEAEIDRLGIQVEEPDIDAQIRRIASSNNMTLDGFKKALEARFIGWESYRKELKEQMIRERLVGAVLQGELRPAEESDARVYYDNHKDEFSQYGSIKVTKYASSDRNALLAAMRNPLILSPMIGREEETLERESADPRLFGLLGDTEIGEFTRMIPVGNMFVSFYVDEKNDRVLLPFEEVKERIIASLNRQNETRAVKNYFEKKRAEGEIKILREPTP